MIRPHVIPVWKKAPFIRLLIPLVVGILLQWYFQISIEHIIASFISFGIAFLLFLVLPVAWRFKLSPVQGLIIQMLFISLGSWLTWQKEIRHNSAWYGHVYRDSSYLVVRIEEPLAEKAKSFKAGGTVEAVIQNGQSIPATGKLLLYFSKDSLDINLNYGDRIILDKKLQPIKNSGNPGTFDYQQYAAFRGIHHHVFLKYTDWQLVAGSRKNLFYQFVYSARTYVLSVLRRTIHSGKDELGITQALLIGYTNDLDKDLVQAYSNTGVVHIIAISGMHLGLIYVLLLWIFANIPLIRRSKFTQLVLILVCLWLFALLTGASPSVLRAAVMFTCIAIGKNIKKQVSVFTSLAVSAFILLCYNPYYLWAAGFQLSYLAVIGIVVFQKPIYHCLYVENKWVDKIWQLISVSTAAQLLTFPVCIYYFHQFPNLFLISNLIAVPLATVVLYAAMVLVTFSWVPFLGTYLGKVVGGLTGAMNACILWLNDLPFAVWDRIPSTVYSTVLLYAILLCFSAWLLAKNKKYLLFGLVALLGFSILTAVNKWLAYKQAKIIVYNIPQHQAIDFVRGNRYQFVGDPILLEDGMLQNFHMRPGRIAQQLYNKTDSLDGIFHKNIFYQLNDKKILIIDKPIILKPLQMKIDLDLLIISRKPTITIAQLTKIFNFKQVVFDASNPDWKIEKWKQECNNLGIEFHAVPVTGAFIYNIGI